MQGMSWHQFKTIINELAITCESGSFQDLISAVGFIVEKGVAGVFHVYADLMGSSGFQFTFDQCYVTEALNDFIMRYSVLSLLTTWKDIHNLVR